ncbi:MAG: MraY family glycosyltransferase [Lentisphaerota bacterium]
MNTTEEKGGLWLTRFLLMLCLVLLVLAVRLDLSSFARSLIVIFTASVAMVSVASPWVIQLALRIGAMDVPGGRHLHERPTPRMGGVAIWAGVIVALLLTSMHYMPNLRTLLICSSLMLVVGVLDDIRGVSALLRLIVQVGSCVILIADGVHVTFLPATWWGVAGEWIITVVWIVGITNAINFLDGIDGLVSGMVVGTGMMYFLLSMLMDAPMLSYCSVALMGASLGFLGFNIKPARIFLGDGGSSFLGFFLATLSIQGEWARHEPLVSFFIPILLLSVPIYDMVFTTIARIASGKVTSFRTWLEYAGRDHLHHRLGDLGLSRGKVAMVICFLNLAVGLGAITLFEARTYGGVALIAQAICVYSIIALLEILGQRKIENGPSTE